MTKNDDCPCMGTGYLQVKAPGIVGRYTTVACPDCSPNPEYENIRNLVWHPHFVKGDM